MKTAIPTAVLVCLVAGSCASSNDMIWLKEAYSEEYIRNSTRRIEEQVLTVKDMTFDEVWGICERTLVRLGFAFYKADRSDGEMRVKGYSRTDVPAGAVTGLPAPAMAERLSLLVTRADGQVVISVAVLAGASAEPGPATSPFLNKEVMRVVEGLKKGLKL